MAEEYQEILTKISECGMTNYDGYCGTLDIPYSILPM